MIRKMDKIEKHNLKEINRLNQRGGRMLSIVDLLKRGTLSLDMASYLTAWVQFNPSFLTAALKSGTGKTTLMGALLNLLKPGIEIKSIEDIPEPKQDVKYMIHEIGEGPYYSYLWEEAPKFFSLDKGTIVSGLHADSFEEIREKLIGEIGVKEKDFQKLDLILIMKKLDRRRVTEIYENQGDFKLIYRWDENKKKFERVSKSKFIKDNKERIEKARRFLKGLIDKDIVELEKVRQELLNFLKLK